MINESLFSLCALKLTQSMGAWRRPIGKMEMYLHVFGWVLYSSFWFAKSSANEAWNSPVEIRTHHYIDEVPKTIDHQTAIYYFIHSKHMYAWDLCCCCHHKFIGCFVHPTFVNKAHWISTRNSIKWEYIATLNECMQNSQFTEAITYRLTYTDTHTYRAINAIIHLCLSKNNVSGCCIWWRCNAWNIRKGCTTHR